MSTVYNTAVQLPLFTLTKVCSRCTPPTKKPIEAFEKTPYGYRSYCNVCKYAQSKAYVAEHPEQVAAQRHARYMANREVISAKSREYNQVPAHKERDNERVRTRYANDAEYRQQYREYQSVYCAAHRAEQRVYQQRWREANPRKNTEYTMRYNALKKGATTEAVDYECILERDGNFCYICEQAILSHHTIEFDHVIPLTRNGTHSESNICVTHKVCNHRKSNKLLEEMTSHQRRGPDC